MAPRKAKRAKTTSKAAGTKTSTRVTRKSLARGVGGLKDMLEMPLDILHEIFMFFLPQDLLSLSRASKAFHDFLLRKSSACYWKQALKRIQGLPPCPKQLIEPAWVALIYLKTTCTNCGNTKRGAKVFWPFFMRLCPPCVSKLIMDQTAVSRISVMFGVPDSTLVMARDSSSSRRYWLGSEVYQVIYARMKLTHSAPGPAGWEAFVRKQSERVEALHAFQKSCLEWVEAEESALRRKEIERLNEARRVCDARYQFIVAKLGEEGWGPELQFLRHDHQHRLEDHKLVNVEKPLTDRGWRTVYNGLVPFMERTREERLAHQLRQRIKRRWAILRDVGPELVEEYLAGHPDMRQYGFTTSDLAHTPECRTLMYAPDDAAVDARTFRALQPEMGAIGARWAARLRTQLRDAVRAETELPRDVDPLELATTTFACAQCAQAFLAFPDLLAHPCQRRPVSCSDPDGGVAPRRALETRRHEGSYVGSPLAFALRAYEHPRAACEIVRLCGRDPRRATVAEMDALDVWLVQAKSIMTWRAAVIEQTRLDHDISSWRVADQEEMSGAKEAEKKVMQSAAEKGSQASLFANRIVKLKLGSYEVMRIPTRSLRS